MPSWPSGLIASRSRMVWGERVDDRALAFLVCLGAADGEAARAVLPCLDVVPGELGELGPAQARVRLNQPVVRPPL